MRILIPVLDFGRAGGYRVLSNLANQWQASGLDVAFCCADPDSAPYYPTSVPIIYPRPIRLLSFLGRTLGSRALTKLGYLGGLALHLRFNTGRRDVIVANHNITVYPALCARAGALIYYIQAYEPEMIHGPGIGKALQRLLARWSYKVRCTRVVNSPLYISWREIKASDVVFPGLDFKIYYPKSPRERGDVPVVGCIGRQEPSKGTPDVIAAVQELWARGVQVRLRVAAFSGDYSGIQGLPGVELVIPQNDMELADYYRSVDVLVAPGTIQLGAVHYPVIEAMACGTPVITTGYIPATQQNAWLVPVNAPSSIASAIEEIVACKPEELSSKIDLAKRQVSDFSWEAVSGKFVEIMKKQLRV